MIALLVSSVSLEIFRSVISLGIEFMLDSWLISGALHFECRAFFNGKDRMLLRVDLTCEPDGDCTDLF